MRPPGNQNLAAPAARYVMETGYDAIRSHEDALMRRMLDGLGALDGVTLYGAARDRTPTAMFNVAGRAPGEVASARPEAATRRGRA